MRSSRIDAVLFAAIAVLGVADHAAASDAKDTPFELFTSNDDAVCKPLFAFYKKFGVLISAEPKVKWEETQEARLREVGFQMAVRIPVIQNRMSQEYWDASIAFYKADIFNDGRDRLLEIELGSLNNIVRPPEPSINVYQYINGAKTIKLDTFRSDFAFERAIFPAGTLKGWPPGRGGHKLPNGEWTPPIIRWLDAYVYPITFDGRVYLLQRELGPDGVVVLYAAFDKPIKQQDFEWSNGDQEKLIAKKYAVNKPYCHIAPADAFTKGIEQ